MQTQKVLAICALVTFTALGGSSAYSVDVGGVSKPCDLTAPQGLDGRFQSVFAVTVRQGQTWERKGTATLIDRSGVFVTAAHVIQAYKEEVIALEQRPAHISVELISPPDTPDDHDFVLLRATDPDWNKGLARDPYPMRLDDAKHQHAQFFGYEEEKDQAAHRDVTFLTMSSGRHVYSGVLFGQSSGALLVDDDGLAFAVVVEHSVPKMTSLNGVHPNQLFHAQDERRQIPVMLLRQALPDLISYIPPSASIRDLMDMLLADVNVELVPRNLGKRFSQIDVAHLTDAVILGMIATKWRQVDRAQYRELIGRIEEAAAQACVKSRFLDDFALYVGGN